MMTIRHRRSRRQVLQWGAVALGGVATACRSAAGDSSKTFAVQTIYETLSTNTVVTATRPPVAGTSYQNSVVTGNFWVDPYVLAQPGIVAVQHRVQLAACGIDDTAQAPAPQPR